MVKDKLVNELKELNDDSICRHYNDEQSEDNDKYSMPKEYNFVRDLNNCRI